tara:strand:+ start:1674 stop:1934 length:261 start_codon:yes stop_codon:yes gene_type:complete
VDEKKIRERAAEIFSDPVFAKVYSELESQYLVELRAADPHDTSETTRILQALQVLELVKNHLHKLSQGMRLETEDFKKLKNGRRNR